MSTKMSTYQKIFIGYVIIINSIAYLMMLFDKYQSKKKGQRISENNLFLLAFLLGAIGIYLGMKAPIYHKAAKSKFKIGIPVLIVLNSVVVGLVYIYH